MCWRRGGPGGLGTPGRAKGGEARIGYAGRMDQVLIGSGWVLGVGGLVLALWALAWDRARGRRRCGKCWYDLSESGKTPVTCPECGRGHRSVRAMSRTRRRWRLAAAGVVLSVAGVVVGLTPAYRAGRLMAMAPSWALAEMVPLFPSHTKMLPVRPPGSNSNHPGWELIRRMAATEPVHPTARSMVGPREMTNTEIAGVVRRMAEGNWYAPAGSRRWAETTGEWFPGQLFRFRKEGPQGALTYPDGTPADAALTEAFAKLDGVMPWWYPRTRAAWPSGVPVTIEDGAASPRWLSYYDGPYPDATWSVRGSDVSGTGLTIPPVGEPGDEVIVDLTLRWFRSHPRSRARAEETAPLREQDFVVRWRVAGRAEDVVEFVDNEPIRRAMVDVFARETAWDFDQFIDGPVWMGEAMDGVGFGVRNEVFDGDELLGSWYFWWLAEDGDWVQRVQGNGMIVDFNGFADRVRAAMDAGTLRVRISGVSEEGLSILDAERIWVGTVEVSLSGAMEAREITGAAGGED